MDFYYGHSKCWVIVKSVDYGLWGNLRFKYELQVILDKVHMI